MAEINVHKERYEKLLEDILDVSNCWNETEKITDDETWGECASDIQRIIEDHAEQM